MVKSCTICKRFKSLRDKESIGKCDFLDEIPNKLKYDLAQYCDFFEGEIMKKENIRINYKTIDIVEQRSLLEITRDLGRLLTKEEFNEIASLIEANGVNTKAVLTTDEAAKYLGVTKSAIYKLTMGRKIPYYRSQGGKLLYFQREEIERWATSCRIATNEELDAKAKSLSKKKGGCL